MSDIKWYVRQPHQLKRFFDDGIVKTDVIFEAGGCEGEDTVRYGQMFPSAKMYVFEPCQKNVALIREHLKQFEQSVRTKNIRVLPVALSDKKGIEKFFVSSGQHWLSDEKNWDYGNKSSSLLGPGEHMNVFDWIKFEETEVVCTTVDAVCAAENISQIDFFHLDVQGAELKVLKGAESVDIRAIWLETSDKSMYEGQPLRVNVEEYLAARGYVCLERAKSGVYEDQLWVKDVQTR